MDASGPTYMLNKSTLVLEGVTLAQVVELVVKVLVDLAGGTVLDQQTAEDTKTAHPHDLAAHCQQLSRCIQTIVSLLAFTLILLLLHVSH